LYECKTYSFTLREEHRSRVFENRLLRKIFGPRREKVTGRLSFIICTVFLILLESKIKENKIVYVARTGRCEIHIEFCAENLKGRDHLEDLGVEKKVVT
jgi:hypothetical protein